MVKNSFWLYLEPYTFIYLNDKDALIYNELSHTFIEYINIQDNDLLKILRLLENKENNYCISVNQDYMNNAEFREFVYNLKKTFSGDLIEQVSNIKPLVTKPQIFINNSVEYLKEDYFYSIGYKSKLTLNELYINTGSYNLRSKCNTIFTSYDEHPKELNIYKVLNKISNELKEFKNLNVINIVCYPNSKFNKINFFIDTVKNQSKVVVHIEFLLFVDNYHLIYNETIDFKVYFEIDSEKKLLTHEDKLNKENITLYCLIESEKHIDQAGNLNKSFEKEIDLYPVYNNNLEFFKKNIFINKDDIQNQDLSIHIILSNSIINRSLWGRFTINEDGIIKTNKNSDSSLNLANNSISEAIIKELNESESWFLTRKSVEPCKNCLYSLLCPPISDYEMDIGRFNLCNVNL